MRSTKFWIVVFVVGITLLFLSISFGFQRNRGDSPIPIQPPIGSITAFAGNIDRVPFRWKICNGEKLSRSEYPDLFKTIGTAWGADDDKTFYLPDLRGRFLRGVDQGSGRDAGITERNGEKPNQNRFDNVGSLQEDALKSHKHRLPITEGSDQSRHPFGFWANFNVPQPYNESNGFTISTEGGAAETRPKNANVFWIIRVK